MLPERPGRLRRLAYGDMIRRRNVVLLGDRGFLRRLSDHGEASGGTRVGDSYEELSRLPSVKVGLKIKDLLKCSRLEVFKGDVGGPCVICQEEYNGECCILRVLKCGHKYHHSCIDQWFIERCWCPLCKTRMID